MSELETLLRSWKPRRPSAKLKRRLFPAADTAFAADDSAGGAAVAALAPAPFRIGWLTPATITLLLGCVLFNQHNAFVLSQSPNCGPLVAAAVSNQSAAAWLPGSFERSKNSLPVDAFDWTNGHGWAANLTSPAIGGRTN